jgi:hypothetical protein
MTKSLTAGGEKTLKSLEVVVVELGIELNDHEIMIWPAATYNRFSAPTAAPATLSELR